MMPEEVLLREWQTAGPKDNPALAGCRPFTAEEAAEVAALTQSKKIEVLEVRAGLRISTRSYVGILRLGPVTLHIRPKLADLSPPTMAILLRYALGLDMVNVFPPAPAPLAEAGFADLIALALLDEVNVLLRGGLLRDYERRTGWRSSPRGRLDLTELARHPMRAQAALPCRYEERTADQALNRLLYASLVALQSLVSDGGIAFDLFSRAALLREMCTAVPLTHVLLDEGTAQLDRRSWHYRPIVQIAELVLLGLGTTVDEAEREAVHSGFLLDMNLLFERFISRLVAEYGPAGLEVHAQEEHRTAYHWRDNPYRWRRPSLRPDIVLRDRSTGTARLILDTKYKTLGPGRRPSPADLYQLTLYSLSFGRSGHVPARVVYPNTSNEQQLASPVSCLDFHGLAGNNTVGSVSFYGLPLLSTASALQQIDESRLRAIVGALVSY